MNLLEVRNLSKQFGGVQALKNVDVTFFEGELLGMIGPNGSGKTTFVNMISGYIPPDSGSIEFLGKSINAKSPHELSYLGLCRTYQSVRVFSNLTVQTNLNNAKLLKGNTGWTAQKNLEICEWLKIDHLFSKTAGSLTLFEQRRLELAMRLALEPKLLLLDEPVGGLASNEVSQMIQVLQELKTYTNIFIIEHTMRVIRELADRVIVLITGEKIAEGPPKDILTNQRVINEYLGSSNA